MVACSAGRREKAEGAVTPPAPKITPATDRSHPMIALSTDVAEAPRAVRTRSPRKTGDSSPKCPPARLAKSKDAGKAKVSFYLDAQTAAKLAVAAIIRQADQSDVAN